MGECMYCGSPIGWDDAHMEFYSDDVDVLLCGECADRYHVEELEEQMVEEEDFEFAFEALDD